MIYLQVSRFLVNFPLCLGVALASELQFIQEFYQELSVEL